jgi:hypothetical protein
MFNKKSKVEKIDDQKARETEQFMRQLQEESRREAIHNFIEKYWKHTLYLILAIIIVSIVTLSIGSYQKNKRMNYASELHQAIILLGENQYEKSEEVLENLMNNRKTPEEIKTVAGMHLGNLLASMKEEKEAIEIYKTTSKIAKDRFIKSMADLMRVNLMIRSGDSNYNTEIEQILNDTENEKILGSLVQEQRFLFYTKNSMKQKANEVYTNSQTTEATDSSRMRMEEMFRSYSADLK